jgi:hypothetical protein
VRIKLFHPNLCLIFFICSATGVSGITIINDVSRFKPTGRQHASDTVVRDIHV